MNKRSLKQEADIINYMDNKYSKRIDKKYVSHRTNSIAELKRVYIYLIGNMKGFTPFENKMKEKYPEAKSYRGKNVEWNFIYEDIWEELMQHEKMSQIIKAKKIDNYEELCDKAGKYFF